MKFFTMKIRLTWYLSFIIYADVRRRKMLSVVGRRCFSKNTGFLGVKFGLSLNRETLFRSIFDKKQRMKLL